MLQYYFWNISRGYRIQNFENDFEEIEEFYGNREDAYFVGSIRFQQLKDVFTKHQDEVSFVLIDIL